MNVCSLYYEPEDFYIKCQELLKSENGGVAVARGYKVSRLDVINRIAYLEDGHAIEYNKCLIATGKLNLIFIKVYGNGILSNHLLIYCDVRSRSKVQGY